MSTSNFYLRSLWLKATEESYPGSGPKAALAACSCSLIGTNTFLSLFHVRHAIRSRVPTRCTRSEQSSRRFFPVEVARLHDVLEANQLTDLPRTIDQKTKCEMGPVLIEV